MRHRKQTSYNDGSVDDHNKAIITTESALKALNDLETVISRVYVSLDLVKSRVAKKRKELELRRMFGIGARGLASLPNEVLEMVFSFTVDWEMCDWKTPLRLSAVCQQFRDIVLRLPYMWTNVSPEVARKAIFSEYLRRSGSLDLVVSYLDKKDIYREPSHSCRQLPYILTLLSYRSSRI